MPVAVVARCYFAVSEVERTPVVRLEVPLHLRGVTTTTEFLVVEFAPLRRSRDPVGGMTIGAHWDVAVAFRQQPSVDASPIDFRHALVALAARRGYV